MVSQPDRRRGRGAELSPSPVKAAALELGLPVTDRVDDVLEVDVDLGVVVAFGQLIKAHVLAAVPMVNLHFSLLPRWRGAAPVERALLAGDTTTGVDLMGLEVGLDTGPVFAEVDVPIRSDATLETLRSELVEAGTTLLVERLLTGLGEPEPQEGEPVYAAKLDRDEYRIDWSQPAAVIERWVRLGGAWTTYEGKRFKIWAAHVVDAAGPPGALRDGVVACGQGGLELVEVQPEGKSRRSFADWANGARPEPGVRLGEERS